MQSADSAIAQIHPIDKTKTVSFFGTLEAPSTRTIAFDFSVIGRGFLDGLSATGEPNSRLDDLFLLPTSYSWTDPATMRPRVPMALCEFVAYKAALVYEKDKVIERNLGGATDPQHFDSSTKDIAIGDTQGFAFHHNGMVFIIMRGTDSSADWKTNLDFGYTDALQGANRKSIEEVLKKRHGEHVVSVLPLIELRRDRHLGFAIGWAAVQGNIISYLKKNFPADIPIVFGGHSLGGALALIGASELKRQHFNVVAVVTFGAPPAGGDIFKQEFNQLELRERTVQFEAEGDSVPRIMRRWYFHLHHTVRDYITRLYSTAPPETSGTPFSVVGNQWEFPERPPLSTREVEGAIRSIIEAAARSKREQEARQAREAAGKKVRDTTAPMDSSSAPKAQTESADGPSGGAVPRDGVKWAIWILGAIVLFLVALFAWLFVRSKLASHAIMDRYALYLSTLSYQHIRSLRADDPLPDSEKLALANCDLDRYLSFIRGPGAMYFKEQFEKSLKIKEDLPVRLKPDLDLATLFSDPSGKYII